MTDRALIGTVSTDPASQILSQTRSNDAYAWTGAVAVNWSYTSNINNVEVDNLIRAFGGSTSTFIQLICRDL